MPAPRPGIWRTPPMHTAPTEVVFETLTLPDGRGLVLATAAGCGTGGELWAASRALCRWQSTMVSAIQGSCVLELGSGIGLGGLYAAALGARSVALTDENRPVLLQNLRSNVERNKHLFDDTTSVQVQVLDWGEDIDPAGPWDFVIGSELTYSARGTRLLCQTIRQILSVGQGTSPRVVLAHQDRPSEPGGMDGSIRELAALAEENGLLINELMVDPEPSFDLGYAVAMVILEVTLAKTPVAPPAAADADDVEDGCCWYPPR